MNNKWIIYLLVAALVIAVAYIVYWKVRLKIQQLAMAMFGTKSFVEGFNRQADVLAETPKSVAGMTRVFEPQIKRDFPEFHLEQYRNKVGNLLVSALQAVTEQKLSLLPEDVSSELKNQVENQIAGNRAAEIRETYRQIKVHQTEITNYQKKNGTCIITFQSAVEHFHYKERNGSVVEGDKERKRQTRYNTELVYIQDEDIADIDNAVGTTCPNCGAPIKSLGHMRCEYCGLAVTPVNLKVWMLHRYYEVDYRHI